MPFIDISPVRTYALRADILRIRMSTNSPSLSLVIRSFLVLGRLSDMFPPFIGFRGYQPEIPYPMKAQHDSPVTICSSLGLLDAVEPGQ